jgi:putative transposase
MRQFVTCKFKLHNLSSRKKQILDYALKEYTLAYADLLEWSKSNLDLIREKGLYKESYTGKSIARLLNPTLRSLHSSAKDSLKQDVGASLASYLELSANDPRTSFPTCRDPAPEAVQGALNAFAKSSGDDYDELRNRLMTICRGAVMPLYFCRADAASQTKNGGARNRNFSLLWRSDKRQLLAVLYLLPQGHDLGQPLNVQQGNLVRLDTGEIFRSNSKAAILVPLQMGHNGWQEQRFLQPAISGKASIQSAFLVKDNDEYYLHTTFALACKGQYSPQAYLGVDRGILFTAAYALVDTRGKVIKADLLEDELRELQIKHGKERERLAKNGKRITRRHYKRQAYDNILHSLVNKLIELAQPYQAQLVFEELNVQVKGSRVVSRFRKLDKFTDYKRKLEGVPFRHVFAAYSSLICHRCGGDVIRNDRLITCTECGYVGHSDINAAINIARRALYRKSDWEGKGGYREFHRSFANDR